MRVRIFKPSVSVTQSSCCCVGRRWKIEPEKESRRQREPLMGWVAADDPFSCMASRLFFETREEAENFARKQGWDFDSDPARERRIGPRNYLENFNPDRRRDGR